MPKDIRGTVRSKYYDYAITLAQEINFTNNPVVYFVYLHDVSEGIFKIIRIRNGEMDEYKSFIESK